LPLADRRSTAKLLRPPQARKSGKAIVLIQAGIHSGESTAKTPVSRFCATLRLRKRAPIFERYGHSFRPDLQTLTDTKFQSPYNRINQNGPDEMGWRATSAESEI
jgi:hypothetical protein